MHLQALRKLSSTIIKCRLLININEHLFFKLIALILSEDHLANVSLSALLHLPLFQERRGLS